MSMSDFIPLLILIGFIFLIYKAIKGSCGGDGKISETGSMICPHCGTRGEPKTITKGSLGMEIILWICFLVPGFIYSIWRLTTRQKGCPACNQIGMIGVNTPNGRMLVEKFKG